MLMHMVVAVRANELRLYLKRYFARADIRVESIGHLKNPFRKALQSSGDIVLLEMKMLPKPIEQSLTQLKDLPEKPTIVLINSDDSPEKNAELLALGADLVLYSGLASKSIAEAVDASIDSRLQLLKRRWPSNKPDSGFGIGSFITRAPMMHVFMDMVQRVIPCSSSVLILGETGAGKELLAKIIHSESPRASAPFIAVNCAAIPDTLFESELFGHEKGAFTGAAQQRRGAFELAHGGTIFLDEIGELPLGMQAKLLRVLQEHEIQPLGSEKTINVDIRVIAATNQDIEQTISERRFRQDLYYRLSVFTLSLPPLRDRREDIPLIAKIYLDDFSEKMNKDILNISPEVVEGLMAYDWPGNVRELINVIERAVILCPGDTITAADIPEGIFKRGARADTPDPLTEFIGSRWRHKTLAEIKDEINEMTEKVYLRQVLTDAGGRVGEAAGKAGIHPRGLYDKMKKYGMDKKDFRSGDRGVL